MYPNGPQRPALAQAFGCARWSATTCSAPVRPPTSQARHSPRAETCQTASH
ncbi:hypothetical protein ACFWWS_25635 [Streptomyces sp. NPDC059083]|uniref:hypothetical protein n=1 Tax=unclassified Streptomyces TaxID=2593676 RepID=UPI0036845C63